MNFTKIIVAGGLAAALPLSLLSPAAYASPIETAVPEHSVSSAASSYGYYDEGGRDGEGDDQDYPFIYQHQGQRYQDIDCGPSVLLMALAARGHAPNYLYNQSLAASLQQTRQSFVHQNPDGYMLLDEVGNAMWQMGVKNMVFWGDQAQAQLDQIKNGKQAIALGQTGIVGPEDNPPGYGHFIFISGYDHNTGNFIVADPLNSQHQVIQVNENTLRQFLRSNTAVNPTEIIIVF